MSYEEWKRKFVDGEKLKGLNEAEKVSGAVNGALNSESDRAIEHAERYYESVRKLKQEYCESRYMEKGLSQKEAHDKANRRYDHSKAVRK